MSKPTELDYVSVGVGRTTTPVPGRWWLVCLLIASIFTMLTPLDEARFTSTALISALLSLVGLFHGDMEKLWIVETAIFLPIIGLPGLFLFGCWRQPVRNAVHWPIWVVGSLPRACSCCQSQHSP